jgi:hypothetical protein
MTVFVQGTPGIPPEAVEIVRMFFITVVGISLGIIPLRAFTRRWERGQVAIPPTSPDVTARLERIERAVEAVAIEVERIAEAQRFSAKLMAEQASRALPGSAN